MINKVNVGIKAAAVGALLCALSSIVGAAPTLTAGTGSVVAGSTITIPISFNPSPSAVAGVQFNVALPVGFSTMSITAGSIVTAAGKSITGNISGNQWVLIVYGVNSNSIAAGTLMTLQFRVASGVANGSYPINLSNIAYVDAGGFAIAGGTSSNGSVSVVPPTPSITSAGTATGTTGVAFSYQITATNSPTSFGATGLPAGLSINTTSGLISGTPSAAGTTSVTLSAINAGGTGQRTLTLTINPPAPVITSASSATATVGTSFSYQIVGTNSPTLYGATGLPAGLSINTTTGLLSGTPSAAGTSSITLSATNAGGTGTKTLTLTITLAAPVITSASTATVTVGTAFSYQITATNSPTLYGATGLPAGVTINTTTGLLSGTPSAIGTSVVTLSATNAGGTGTKQLTITVNPLAPVITSASSATATVGTSFSYQITAINSPTLYGATGLPAGVTINTTTGLLSGTPSAIGTSVVTLSATNAGGTGTKILTITVNPLAPVITSASSATATVGTSFSYQITATNSPTLYGATGLPAGVTINTTTGLLSGTPSAIGTSVVTLSATNAGGTGTKQLTITVNPLAPVVTSAATATATVGTFFSYQIVGTNSPTLYNATGLPAGLSINTTTGLLSGTPSVEGTSSITLSATNAGGTGNRTLTLTAFSACDVNRDSSTNVADVQLEVNMALFIIPCTADLNLDTLCNVVDVQRVVNATLGGACVTP